MFRRHGKTLIVVHDGEVCWASADRFGVGHVHHRVALSSVLEDTVKALSGIDFPRGGRPALAILPNHWFGSETYPFRSQKPSLIEPFLERKLSGAFPDRPFIRAFFDYKILAGEADPGLCVHFLQDEKGHRLYEALRQVGQAPPKMTAPAFLWEEHLQKTLSDFPAKGVLLVDIVGTACELYFYFKGNYLFSRSVVLPDADDRMGVLVYEVNQSLYLFSQKARSDLDRIYLLGDAAAPLEDFRDGVGREVVDLRSVSEPAARSLDFSDAPGLNGLLPTSPSGPNLDGFGIMHREVKRALEWRPVQAAGIAIGAALLLAVAGQQLALGRVLQKAQFESRQMRNQVFALSVGDLSEFAAAVDRVLMRMEKPGVSDTALKVLDSLPASVRLESFELVMEPGPSLALRARVEARDMDRLSGVLSQLVDSLNRRFHGGDPVFSIRDIDIGGEPAEIPGGLSRYHIAFSLDPT